MSFAVFDELENIDQFPNVCIQNNYYGCFINKDGSVNGDYLQKYTHSKVGDRIRLGKIYYKDLYVLKNNIELKREKDINVNEFTIIDKNDQVVKPENIRYGVNYRIGYKDDLKVLLICVKSNDFTSKQPDIFMIRMNPLYKSIIATDKRLYWKFWPVQFSDAASNKVESCYYSSLGKQSCSTATNCLNLVYNYCDQSKNFSNGLCKAIFYDYHNELSNLRFDKLKENQCAIMREKENIDPGSIFDYSVCKCVNIKYRLTEGAKKTLRGVPFYCIDDECSTTHDKNFYKLSYMKDDQCPKTVCSFKTVDAGERGKLNVVQKCETKEKDERDLFVPDPVSDTEPSFFQRYLPWILGSLGIIFIIIIVVIINSRNKKKQ